MVLLELLGVGCAWQRGAFARFSYGNLKNLLLWQILARSGKHMKDLLDPNVHLCIHKNVIQTFPDQNMAIKYIASSHQVFT
jgi:hypothetical protein